MKGLRGSETPIKSDSSAQERFLTYSAPTASPPIPPITTTHGVKSAKIGFGSIRWKKGWSHLRFVCVCGYRGSFRGGKAIPPHCPVCRKVGPTMLDDTYIRPGLKSPLRKFKRRCAVCGVPSAGLNCRKHTDQKAAWDLKKCQAHSIILAKWWLSHPERRVVKEGKKRSGTHRHGRFATKPRGWTLPTSKRGKWARSYWGKWGVIQDGVFVGLMKEVKMTKGGVNGLLEARRNVLSKTVKEMGNARKA